jgi:protein tyrosine/serine phosphatase
MSTPIRPARTFALLLVVLALAGAGVAFKPAILANLSPRNFGVVEEGKVYRAGQFTPAALHALNDQYHFKTIIDLGSEEIGTAGDRRNQRAAEALGIPRYRFQLIGNATGNPNWYVHTLRLMTDPARQPVLVHCGAGSERTGCAVILYNTLVHGASIADGLRDSRNYKHDPARNPRLEEVLAKYADSILDAVRNGGQVPGVEPIPEPAPVSSPPAATAHPA